MLFGYFLFYHLATLVGIDYIIRALITLISLIDQYI